MDITSQGNPMKRASTPILRQYHPADEDAVLDIWERASRFGHSFLSEDFFRQERRRVRDTYLPNAEAFVAEVDGSILGFIALVGNEVGGLFVDPDSHRRGIGRALMLLAAELRTELELEVFRDNHSARSFYSQCGFREVSEHVHKETGQLAIRLARFAGG